MEKSIGRMITVLYRKSQSYLSFALSKYNLTSAEKPIFAILQIYDDVTQEALSSLLSIDKAATARTVKSLEKKGFVKRVQDEHDKRQNRVTLTDEARKLWPDVKNELLNFNKLLTQNIDTNSLDIIYDGLLLMEENAVAMAKNKTGIAGREGACFGERE